MTKRTIELDPPYIDEEEKELIEGFHDALETGTAVSMLTPERQDEIKAIARNTIDPPKQKITTRVAQSDLARLKAKAMEKGIPYQTLLASIIHQYVEGGLVELETFYQMEAIRQSRTLSHQGHGAFHEAPQEEIKR